MPVLSASRMPSTPAFAAWASNFEPLPDAGAIDALQRVLQAEPIDAPLPRMSNGLDAIRANHHCNRLLWEQEDQARRPDVPDAWIVQNKRAIDRYNQQRNEAIEAIDEWLLSLPSTVPARPDAWLNSETAGSLIDRLSINLLKQHHMALHAEGNGLEAHRVRCANKLRCLGEQRQDLLFYLQCLLKGLVDGSCRFRLYRQFKMYNDPALNPYLARA